MIVGYARVSTDGQTLRPQQCGTDASRGNASVRGEGQRRGHGQEATRQGYRGARPRGRSVGHSLRPTCEIDPRSAQRPRRCGEGRGWLPIPGGCVGRHHHGTWPTYADDPRWPCRVRRSLILAEPARAGPGPRREGSSSAASRRSPCTNNPRPGREGRRGRASLRSLGATRSVTRLSVASPPNPSPRLLKDLQCWVHLSRREGRTLPAPPR